MVADASPDLKSAVPIACAVLETHVVDSYGRCAGCYGNHGIWTPHPCTSHRWAERLCMTAEGTPT